MKRYWISWEEPVDASEDSRPNGEWPTPDAIKAWWNSGGNDDFHTLCAVVDARDQRGAEEEVARSWPNHGAWRFCEEKPLDFRPGDRFPWPAVEGVKNVDWHLFARSFGGADDS